MLKLAHYYLKLTPNLELSVNQFNNTTPDNNNDPENISSLKYDIDEIHNVGIPNKNKSLSLFHVNGCSLNKILMIFNVLRVTQKIILTQQE